MSKLTLDEELTLWLGALRYYMGRRTYAVSMFTILLCKHWSSFNKYIKALIIRDVEREFDQDEQDPDLQVLGHNCDKKDWEKVRSLWKPNKESEEAIKELESGKCKKFSTVKELLEDLEK